MVVMVTEKIVKDHIARPEFSIAVAEDIHFKEVELTAEERKFISDAMRNYEKAQQMLAVLWNKECPRSSTEKLFYL